jgi:hypothetical protein
LDLVDKQLWPLALKADNNYTFLQQTKGIRRHFDPLDARKRLGIASGLQTQYQTHHGAAERVGIYADHQMLSMRTPGRNLHDGRSQLHWPKGRMYVAW